jgi:5'(3')-deoxyribonucleotidase
LDYHACDENLCFYSSKGAIIKLPKSRLGTTGAIRLVDSAIGIDEMTKSALSGLIIGVDLDGVCADFYPRMREIAAEWLEKRAQDLTPEVSYGLPEWGIKDEEQYNSLHRFAVTQRELFKTVPMIPGARKYLRQLSDDGARIRIITHRLFIHFFHKVAVEQTIDWLDRHGIPYWDLCFMKEKEQVGADIYIDDNPNNVMSLRQRGLYTICFANSTNKKIGRPKAISWKHAHQLVHEWARKRGTKRDAK